MLLLRAIEGRNIHRAIPLEASPGASLVRELRKNNEAPDGFDPACPARQASKKHQSPGTALFLFLLLLSNTGLAVAAPQLVQVSNSSHRFGGKP